MRLRCVGQVLAATAGVREHLILEHPEQAETAAAAAAAAATGGGDGGGGGGGGGPEQERRSQELTEAMRSLFYELHSSGPAEAPLRPVAIMQAVSARHERYVRRAQQDSHEMLRQLLEGLRTEMSSVLRSQQPSTQQPSTEGGRADDPSGGAAQPPPPAEPRTLVDDLFSGELRSTVVCLSCGHISWCVSRGPRALAQLGVGGWRIKVGMGAGPGLELGLGRASHAPPETA